MSATLVSPVLVGRKDELTTLAAALERAEAGEPAIVLAGGEAGVGKTRLVEEAAARADAPEIDIVVPADGATYPGGEPITARFACRDAVAGVLTFGGTVADGAPVDASPGEHAFTVTAVDRAGNTRKVTTRYTVLGPPVSPGSPALPTSGDEEEGDEPGPVDDPPWLARPADVRRRGGRRRARAGRRSARSSRAAHAQAAVVRLPPPCLPRRADARGVVLRRPAGDTFSPTLTAIGPDGTTVRVRRMVRP